MRPITLSTIGSEASTSASSGGRIPSRTSSRKPASITDRWSVVMLPLPSP
jgi:hypothetical protein